MSKHSSIIEITDSSLKELLLLGNVFDSPKKMHLLHIINQIEIGNKKLYRQYVNILLDTIKQNPNQNQINQLMYDHITELAITANPILIHDLNNDVFASFDSLHKKNEGLQNHVSLWKHMYNGKKDKEDFPNVAKTLEKISTPSSIQITGKLANFFAQFNKNLEKTREKKVQFFEDFDQSSLSQSFADESQIAEIVYMDIMEIKAIRQKVESQLLTEENCTEYLIKMKTYLNLRPVSLSGDLLTEFNKEKVWARHFIDHHQEYLRPRGLQNNQARQQSGNVSANATSPLMISLSKDEESIEQPPPARFSKNNLKPIIQPLTPHKEQSLGYDEINVNKKKLESEIKNFTINEVPIDESRFTERSSKKGLPVFNNSLNEGTQNLGSLNNFYGAPNTANKNYQMMSFEPAQHLQNAVKPVPISRPCPQDTLPLDESTIHNMSIPVQIRTPTLKTNNYQPQHFPKNLNYGYPTQNQTASKQSFSASQNNPFANSKTNYNPQPVTQTPYEIYKKQQINIDYSPIRNRMTENDLDSDNIDEPIMIKPHYQWTTYNNEKQQLTPSHAQTYNNFYNTQSPILNLASNQKVHSQQFSPRSHVFTESKSSKKRLSELTSEKKQRKHNAPKQDHLNYPEEYVFRPYSVHFNRNFENFNNFKRNCLEQKFPLYVSSQLVVKCVLKKIKDSKIQVQISYENQTSTEMKMSIIYRVPKCFKIEKVAKVPRKFMLKNCQTHVFNLIVLQFPLEMCLLDLSYSVEDEEVISNLMVPLPITIKNFIETLATTRSQWTKNFTKLTLQSESQPFIVEKTFQLNRQVVDPSQLERVLSKEFINIGASEGYSVQEYGCVCHYRQINGLIFLVRISIRVDHIATVSIISEHETTDNERDFMKYYLEILVTLLAKYSI